MRFRVGTMIYCQCQYQIWRRIRNDCRLWNIQSRLEWFRTFISKPCVLHMSCCNQYFYETHRKRRTAGSIGYILFFSIRTDWTKRLGSYNWYFAERQLVIVYGFHAQRRSPRHYSIFRSDDKLPYHSVPDDVTATVSMTA